MHRAGFLLFTLKGLEVVQATLASDLALELFEPVEGHACSVGPGSRSGVRCGRNGVDAGGRCSLISVKDLASLADLKDLLVKVGFGGIQDRLSGFGEEDAFASAGGHSW